MMYLLALILPPLALLFSGKIFQALLNLVIWLASVLSSLLTMGSGDGYSFALWLTAAAHAAAVVHSEKADARTERLIDAMDDAKKD